MIIYLVDYSFPAQGERIVGFKEIGDRFVLGHFSGSNIEIGAQGILFYFIEGLNGRVVILVPLAEKGQRFLGRGISDFGNFRQLFE